MPGLRLFSFHEGDRSEYLAHYLLSYFASVVPVPRQEDYGLDFLCGVVRRTGNRLHVKRYFGVQVKSAEALDVEYGGMKKGRWKRWEVTWLRPAPIHWAINSESPSPTTPCGSESEVGVADRGLAAAFANSSGVMLSNEL
jgi:hypothetical protein